MSNSDAGHTETGMTGGQKPERLMLLTHDIRSAISDVIGGLDLVDDSGMPSTSVLQLERVRAAGESLGRLVEELIGEATGEPVFTIALAGDARVPLSDLVRTLQRRWSGHAQMQGLTLNAHLANNLPVLIDVDGNALERILSNLLSNALKYAERGVIRLVVGMTERGDLKFTIEDEGPGFSDAALDRLFQFRGRPADAMRPGTGMGLHICKDLADAMGGTLVVRNGVDGGGLASLILPPQAWRGARDGQEEGRIPDLTGLRVLVAEDNPTNQLIFAQMLTQLKAEATIVEDGRQALDALMTGRHDIALIDIDMPVLSGIDVLRNLRNLPDSRGQIPVLAVTAYALRAYRDEIYRAGADGILAKPVLSVIAFAEAISSLIRKSGRQPQSPQPLYDAGSGLTRIDRTRLQQLLNVAGPEGRTELLRRLQSDLSNASDGLQAALENEDTLRVRAETHILISLAGAVGADGLYRVVERMNAAAHRGEQGELYDLAPAAKEGVAHLLAEIRGLAQATSTAGAS